MHGNDVVTIDGDKIGHVVDERDGYLIVEHGLLKTKHALPQKFVEQDGDSGVLRTTLSKEPGAQLTEGQRRLRSQAIAEHYGLAEGFEGPPTRGLGDLRARRSGLGGGGRLGTSGSSAPAGFAGNGPFDEPPSSPGVTGGDRRRDFPRTRRTEPGGTPRGSSSPGAHPARCAPRPKKRYVPHEVCVGELESLVPFERLAEAQRSARSGCR